MGLAYHVSLLSHVMKQYSFSIKAVDCNVLTHACCLWKQHDYLLSLMHDENKTPAHL